MLTHHILISVFVETDRESFINSGIWICRIEQSSIGVPRSTQWLPGGQKARHGFDPRHAVFSPRIADPVLPPASRCSEGAEGGGQRTCEVIVALQCRFYTGWFFRSMFRGCERTKLSAHQPSFFLGLTLSKGCSIQVCECHLRVFPSGITVQISVSRGAREAVLGTVNRYKQP
jgi:hypothetical protein